MGTLSFLSKLKNRQRGVLLVDALVGIAILAIGLVGIMQLYIYGTKSRADASMREKAVQIATERIEMLKAKENAAKDDITDSFTGLSGNIKLADQEVFTVNVKEPNTLNLDTTNHLGDDKLMLVDVNVAWTAPDGKADSTDLYTYLVITQ